MEAIVSFQGDNRYLSNFFKLSVPVLFADLEFSYVENAYVAAKTASHYLRTEIQIMTPSQAKLFGEKIFEEKLFPNREWSEDFGLFLLKDLIFQKFSKNLPLKKRLLSTGDCDLIDGNTWHDNFLGRCSCGGCPKEKLRPEKEQNNNGKILMLTRACLRQN